MMTHEENEYLVRTNAGTPMGELFRRYWIPAAMVSELPTPDCPPVRVRLLGERLVAFRDTQGRIGLMDEFCAHRGVSMWFGRNEENGLRCPYHGWKYDYTGQCVELPAERTSPDYCKRIKLKAYPCVEKGGVIWTYMGPPGTEPPVPDFEWTNVPSSHVYISKRWQESNYLQAMEGGIDSSHVSFLHRFDVDSDPLHRNTEGAKYARNTNTVFDVAESPGGLLIGARRSADEGRYYWRISQWMMPWYTLIPPYKGNALNGHAWVPMDDDSCVAWTVTFHPTRPLTNAELDAMHSGKGVHCELVPGTFRPVANRENDYLMDRRAQVEKRSYSGIKGIAMQDASLQESMGPIADRTKENLVSTDQPIVMARIRLRQAAKALELGQTKTGPGTDTAAQHVRSASFVLDANASYRDTVTEATKMKLGEPFVAV
jgi:phenylpropionate dioxygenase-like ring-hydroxylating dioxygenase large terminal subunit